MQSTLHSPRPPSGLHVGVIMDGNGRWALAEGRSRRRGHVAGARTARAVVEAAPALGIGVLTLYAFSSDNWKRPPTEIRSLMRLLKAYLAAETPRCVETGVRVEVIGRRDRIPPVIVREIVAAEGRTAPGDRLLLRLAIDYSSRGAILAAGLSGARTAEGFRSALQRASHGRTPVPDLDLLIRTGGERRLSDFLLWECAYAELFFTDLPWPAFGPRELEDAIRDFHSRERRFGGLRAPGAGPPQSAAGASHLPASGSAAAPETILGAALAHQYWS